MARARRRLLREGTISSLSGLVGCDDLPPADGHRFASARTRDDAMTCCHCGASWFTHRYEPKPCPTPGPEPIEPIAHTHYGPRGPYNQRAKNARD